jgi:hypothetical protein
MTVGERLCTNPLATTWATALGPGLRDRVAHQDHDASRRGSGNNDMESPSKKLKHCLVSW